VRQTARAATSVILAFVDPRGPAAWASGCPPWWLLVNGNYSASVGCHRRSSPAALSGQRPRGSSSARPSFGKGRVQTVNPRLANDGRRLALTSGLARLFHGPLG
jgi:hypothetical protein